MDIHKVYRKDFKFAEALAGRMKYVFVNQTVLTQQGMMTDLCLVDMRWNHAYKEKQGDDRHPVFLCMHESDSSRFYWKSECK